MKRKCMALFLTVHLLMISFVSMASSGSYTGLYNGHSFTTTYSRTTNSVAGSIHYNQGPEVKVSCAYKYQYGDGTIINDGDIEYGTTYASCNVTVPGSTITRADIWYYINDTIVQTRLNVLP